VSETLRVPVKRDWDGQKALSLPHLTLPLLAFPNPKSPVAGALRSPAVAGRSRATSEHSYPPPTCFSQSKIARRGRPSKLSEPAETERRRANFTHFNLPTLRSSSAKRVKSVVGSHSHIFITLQSSASLPRLSDGGSPSNIPTFTHSYTPYTMIRAKPHRSKGHACTHHPWVLCCLPLAHQ